MPRQIILRQPSSNRRQPLLRTQPSPKNSRFAEIAGGTTAECAAVCCCCPCTVVNLLVLAVYTLPAGLCRRILRKRRRMLLNKKGSLSQRRRRCSCDSEDTELRIHPASIESSPDNYSENIEDVQEKEMWDRFYGTGFWRSPSQRE